MSRLLDVTIRSVPIVSNIPRLDSKQQDWTYYFAKLCERFFATARCQLDELRLQPGRL